MPSLLQCRRPRGRYSSQNESRAQHWVVFVPITMAHRPWARAASPGQPSAEFQLCVFAELGAKETTFVISRKPRATGTVTSECARSSQTPLNTFCRASRLALRRGQGLRGGGTGFPPRLASCLLPTPTLGTTLDQQPQALLHAFGEVRGDETTRGFHPRRSSGGHRRSGPAWSGPNDPNKLKPRAGGLCEDQPGRVSGLTPPSRALRATPAPWVTPAKTQNCPRTALGPGPMGWNSVDSWGLRTLRPQPSPILRIRKPEVGGGARPHEMATLFLPPALALDLGGCKNAGGNRVGGCH